MSRVLLAVCAALLFVGCGALPNPEPAGGPADSPPASPGSVGGAPGLTVSDADNGRSFTVAKGSNIRFQLHSTYWTFQGSSNATVLKQTGQPAVTAAPGCVPGGGCGIVELSFRAVGAGQADVTASRTSCGEARSCTGDQGNFQVSIVVSG